MPRTPNEGTRPQVRAEGQPRYASSHPRRVVFTAERVLAIAGALVTILGVGFLLALAIASGWFGPIPRVLSLAALSGVLAFAARRIRGTSGDAAVALAATSSAAAFGVAVAMTTVYEWVPPLVGIIGALVVTGAGVFVAHRWRSEILAGLIYLQALIVLPIIISLGDPLSFTQYCIFAAVAYAPVAAGVIEHRWVRLFRAASAGLGLVVLLTVAYGAMTDASHGLVPILTAITVTALVAGVATHLDELAVLGNAVALLAVSVLGLRSLDVDVAGLRLDSVIAALLTVIACIAAMRYRGGRCTLLAVTAATFLLLATSTLPLSSRVITVLLAFEALALLVAARARRSLPLWLTSVVFATIAVVGLLLLVPLPALLATSVVSHVVTWEGVATGVLVAAVGALQVLSRSIVRPPALNPHAHTLLGIAVGLYGASSGIAGLGLLAGASQVQSMGANVLTTMVWVGVAIAMILRPASPVTRAGYALLVAAIAKLFLADLNSVDGVLRAVLFVITGLALIAAASQIRKRTEVNLTGPQPSQSGSAADAGEPADAGARRTDSPTPSSPQR